ncbi:PAS domain S-box-containing protein [Saccharicrinis carchari]|uniref:histidine kinase n=1 Tax=Saccharicrinis carchari TaxID=1168039 RepID=A0A521D521_SACCC|nr:PAS domain S-box protein [Saccharicrinis carchari]SMO66796.1 PAS domain S-box-containing protein [Saccharicrinis carchari]
MPHTTIGMIHLEELQLAINELQTIVVVTDINGNIRYVNNAFQEKYGYTPEEVIGRSTRLLKSDFHGKHFYKELWKTIHSGETWEGVFLNKTKSGRLIWEEAKISPVKIDGKIAAFIAIKEDVTYKKELEEQFRKEKFLLDELFDNAPVGVILFEPEFTDEVIIDFKVIKANPIAANVFNSLGLMGLSLKQFLPDFPDLAVRGRWMLTEKQNFEIYFDSINKHLNMRTFPLENERFCMYVYDVTPYKNTISALEESEQRYSSLVEDSPALIRRYNKQGIISYINRNYADFFNKAPEQLIGSNIFNLLSKVQKEQLKAGLNGLSIHNPIIEYEQNIQLPDGTVRWKKWIDRALIDAEGNIAEFQSVGMDFTQLKKAEKLLEEQKSRLDAIFDNAIMGIGVMNKQGNMTMLNHRLKEMFEYDLDVAPGNCNYFDHILNEDQEVVQDNFKRLFSGKIKHFNIQRKFITKKGKEFWADIFASPITMVNGKYTETVGLMIDITEKYKMQVELKESEQKLKKLNNTKDKLFSVIAHDIRNPFNAILGFSTMLNKRIDEFSKDEVREFTKRILEASEQTYKLLEDLLTWAKSQLGQLQARQATFDLNVIVKECIESLGAIAQGKNIRLINKVNENTLVTTDVEMFKFVIRNLIHNGIKFSHRDSTVECGIISGTNADTVTLYVKDYGIGIKPEKLKVLFNLEEFLSTSGTSQEKGTGLGLSLSKEMIELNGGSIEVSSIVNMGSEFRITLCR